jgi:hypothetical protein
MGRPDIENMQIALEIISRHNPLKNDHDAYLLAVCDWALFGDPKPDPASFGVEEAK